MSPKRLSTTYLQHFMCALDHTHAEVVGPAHFVLAKTTGEIRRAKRQGKIALALPRRELIRRFTIFCATSSTLPKSARPPASPLLRWIYPKGIRSNAELLNRPKDC
jgi:hypothetical protein